MKHYYPRRTAFISTLLLMLTLTSYSKNKFSLNSSVGVQTVIINGREYSIDSIGKKIPTHYPGLDTLSFKDEDRESNFPIICNFKPDTSYSLIGACCGSIDIVPASKLSYDSLKYWSWPEDIEKIKYQLMDKPFISIRTKKNLKDSIYAWHEDASCITEHKVISTQPWRLGVPPKCAYWNNITTILFFKTDNTLPSHEETDLEEFLSIKNIVGLTSISFRLFDDGRFIIIYDEKNNKATLKYE
ncbi:MAG: hypothetical protein JWO09_2477 [Bacteroidetes bacterium]|nr:hypothetical protein [Bacteroidota bacterium]